MGQPSLASVPQRPVQVKSKVTVQTALRFETERLDALVSELKGRGVSRLDPLWRLR